jgi:hypothetical protein
VLVLFDGCDELHAEIHAEGESVSSYISGELITLRKDPFFA